MNEIEKLFKINWLDEWKKMMCRKMFNNDSDFYCNRPIEAFPCLICPYYVEKAD